VIDVVTANRRQRRSKMTSKITEETGTQEAKATGAKPKGKKKAPGSQRRAPVAPKKAKAEKTASLSKKAPKGATKAKGSRKGSKTAQILDLLKRPGGVSSKELMETTYTEWPSSNRKGGSRFSTIRSVGGTFCKKPGNG
jgi:hypothetical protein